MDIATIIKFIKLPKNVIAIICLISGVLIFGTEPLLKKLALNSFKEKYNVFIGVLFLFSFCYSFYALMETFVNFAKKQISIRRHKKDQKEIRDKLIKNMALLDDKELAIVREFFLQRKNILEMSVEDVCVLSLVKNGVLEFTINEGYQTNITGQIGYLSLTELADDYFSKIDFEKYSHIKRPEWIQKIEAQMKLDRHKRALVNEITDKYLI